MNLIAAPVSSGLGRKAALWVIAPVLVALAAWSAWKLFPSRPAATTTNTAKTYVIVPMDFPVKISKDGELQAVNNREIISMVEGSTTIQTIVPEGTSVKKGQIILTLDSSVIKERIETTTLDLERAEADLTTAKELKDIQETTNAASLDSAKVRLQLAELDLKQYVEGTYPQQLSNAETDLLMAEISLKNQEEKLSQTRALFLKNYVTATNIKDDELAVTTARNNYARSAKALEVLKNYTHAMDMASKQNTLSQSRLDLERTIRMNASNMAQRVAEVNARTRSRDVLVERMEKYQQQLAACTIAAETDGLVVYASSGSNERFSNQTPIQEGAAVREQQRLIRLPDTSTMKVVVRINEAMVSRLREGQRAQIKVVGVPEPLGATLTKISVLSDSGQRQFNPEIKEYPVDLTLDETPPGLKPGMGSMAEIYIDHVYDAMTVPLGALYASGSNAYVFVRDGEQFKPRPVRVGRTNEAYAEIVGEGVKEGEEVKLLGVSEGQELLDKAGIKNEPATQPSGMRRGRGGRRGAGGGGDGAGNGAEVAPGGGGDGLGALIGDGSGGGRRGRGRGGRGGAGGGGGMGPGPDGPTPDGQPQAAPNQAVTPQVAPPAPAVTQ